ncbi:MAG TPA: DUF4835 family protein [bacterium]|jgi:hypothetical protein
MKWIRFTPFLLFCALLVSALQTRPAAAQLVVPEVVVNTERLPQEARDKLSHVDSLLTEYLKAQPWAGDNDQYDFPIQINIFFTDYTPDPQEDKYKAKLIATNKADVRFEDVRWEFGLKQPIAFHPNRFEPFKSVVEFYVWMLLGTEFDKLEKLGGQTYYDKAKQIYLESSSSLYYFGWDKRIDLLRTQTDDRNKTSREFNYYYYSAIYYDDDKNYENSAAYLYYAILKMDKLPFDFQQKFLESNRRELAEAVGRCRPKATNPDKVKSDMAKALIQIDPGHKEVYEGIAPAVGTK